MLDLPFRPDPEHVAVNEHGVTYQRYQFRYEHCGSLWDAEIWASSFEDAQERLRSLRETADGLTEVYRDRRR